jgi:hypothetical protein
MTNQQQIIIEQFGLSTVRNNATYLNLSGSPIGNDLNSGIGFTKSLLPQGSEPDTALFTSAALGTPIFDTLIFRAGFYIDAGTPVAYPDFRVDNALITLTQAHNVIITPIQGRDGEIIEYSGKASFRINIKGGVFGTGLQRPSSQIATLNAVLQSNAPLIVLQCGFLTDFNISQMVILDKTFPQVAGGYNYQLFEFNAIQDTPVILAQSQVQKTTTSADTTLLVAPDTASESISGQV